MTHPLEYCSGCDRYNLPPYRHIKPESTEFMQYCLKRIKNLSKVKLIDSSFVWTEEHSKRIKVKVVVQKELLDKIVAQEAKILTFVVEYVQCKDCMKQFTKHTWRACIQARHKAESKTVFLEIEQQLIKAKLDKLILKMEETKEGVDFFFALMNECETVAHYLKSMFPCQVKKSSQVVSQDFKSNTMNKKYVMAIDILPIYKGDLVLLSSDSGKKLGGIGSLLYCVDFKSNVRFLDLQRWKYIFLSEQECYKLGLSPCCSSKFLKTFLVEKIIVDEPDESFTVTASLAGDESTVVGGKKKKKQQKVPCNKMFLREPNSEDVIETKSYFSDKIKEGDLVLGYPLDSMNVSALDEIDVKEVPVVVVKKLNTKKSKKERLRIKDFKLENEKEETEFAEQME